MKRISSPVYILIALLLFPGCSGKRSSPKESDIKQDKLVLPDTGYTGIKKFYSNENLIKEATYKNGIRHGEMKSYYQGGQLYQSFWYENGLREDSARWYYLEGQVFRSTPFSHDTIHGTQKQYYKNGRLKAKINYIKGLRTPGLEEYTKDGKLVRGYPEINYNIIDNYSTTGKIKINLELSAKTNKVRFYRGEFTDGVFDTLNCIKINPVGGVTYLVLKKTGTPQAEYVGIIAAILTEFGNNYLTYKKINLPYNDLK